MLHSPLLGCAVLLVTATIAAALMRWVRCPGAAVVGGVLAGVLLGPSLAGRMLPEPYEQIMVGGVVEREARDRVVSRQGADLLAAGYAGADAEALAARHERELEETSQAWEDARWAHQAPLRRFTLVTVALTLLLAGASSLPPGAHRHGLATPISIAAWAALLPGALAYVVLHHLLDMPLGPSLLAGAAAAIGPYLITAGDREAADQAELGGASMMQTAGRLTSLAAIGGAAWALWLHSGPLAALPLVALLAMVPGWLLPASAPGSLPSVPAVRDDMLVPCVAALAALKVDLFVHTAFWPILLMVLLNGDGRWIAATIGALLPGGRNGLRTMRLVMGSMACGPTQLAVTAVGVHSGALPGRLAVALVIGAVVIAVTTPLRRSVARRLVEAEEEMDRLKRE